MGQDDSDVREYHRRRDAQNRKPEDDEMAGPKLPAFMPRNVRVKQEEPEMDFKTRMKMMSKAKAKTGLFVKKEDIKKEGYIKKEGDIKREKRIKKERRRKNSSENSEDEEKRITKKAKKKLGLSVSVGSNVQNFCGFFKSVHTLPATQSRFLSNYCRFPITGHPGYDFSTSYK